MRVVWLCVDPGSKVLGIPETRELAQDIPEGRLRVAVRLTYGWRSATEHETQLRNQLLAALTLLSTAWYDVTNRTHSSEGAYFEYPDRKRILCVPVGGTDGMCRENYLRLIQACGLFERLGFSQVKFPEELQ